jgi:hypothetical protein
MAEKIIERLEQDMLWKLASEVSAKNGMPPSRMKRALERLGMAM